MIQSIAVPVAEALHQALSVFHAVSQESLRAVRVENDLERVIFDFDKGALVVEGNPDDDSIETRLANQGEFASLILTTGPLSTGRPRVLTGPLARSNPVAARPSQGRPPALHRQQRFLPAQVHRRRA